ncbi:MAG: IMP dehydrogenase, partial [Treponema sp.]|nr:IMP dehydrogenase [Treponema sp.]
MEFQEALSYDDVLLLPGYSDILPKECDVASTLCKGVVLNVPIISAAMDTVTEEKLAIAIALEGGAGVIHRNLSPEEQARQVGNVKRYLNWVIDSPVTVMEDALIRDVKELRDRFNVSGMPVLSREGVLTGIITSRDLRFCQDDSLSVREVMTKNVVVEQGDPSVSSAREKFDKHRIEKLPVVDAAGRLTGLITVKDMEKHASFPHAATDKQGRLVVGAAVSPQDYPLRLPLLLAAKVDFVVLDTAHGDSKNVMDAVTGIKKDFAVPVIGGNVASKEGTRRLIDAGADAVKVGIGP